MKPGSPRIGDKASCPNCGLSFTLRSWQVSDGPCRDGLYYCLYACERCGCMPKDSDRGAVFNV